LLSPSRRCIRVLSTAAMGYTSALPVIHVLSRKILGDRLEVNAPIGALNLTKRFGDSEGGKVSHCPVRWKTVENAAFKAGAILIVKQLQNV